MSTILQFNVQNIVPVMPIDYYNDDVLVSTSFMPGASGFSWRRTDGAASIVHKKRRENVARELAPTSIVVITAQL